MRSLILSALILASAFQTALGEQKVLGDFVYEVVTLGGGGSASGESYVRIIKFQGSEISVAFPSEIEGLPVKILGRGNTAIFLYQNPTTSISIPTSVTTIESRAFVGCSLLTSISIPESVTQIGSEAFAYCSSLQNINLPTGLTSIENSAFSFCSSLTSLTIPNSVTSIGEGAFYSCTGLTSITIPNSVASIGGVAFYRCSRLTSITIPNSVTRIGNEAFLYCTTLSSVYLPVRFETTYPNFGLTSAQVVFYDVTNPAYLMGQQSVINNPSAHNLYTATQYTANFNAGKDSVLNSPNSNGLYTANQMQAMAIRDLVLIKNANGSFTLNYDIEKSEDLQSWTTHAPLSLTLTNLPPDKAFVRIKAKQ